MSVVDDSVTSNKKGQLMSYNHNPTVTELRQAYEVAYGEFGVNRLVGALFANVTDMKINQLYNDAIEDVREDLEDRGLL